MSDKQKQEWTRWWIEAATRRKYQYWMCWCSGNRLKTDSPISIDELLASHGDCGNSHDGECEWVPFVVK